MAMKRIQFQQGLSLPAFLATFGTETQCEEALELPHCPHGFCCPGCGKSEHYLLKVGKHKTIQCKSCRVQTSLIAGTLIQNTHLPLHLWFLAIYLHWTAKALFRLSLGRIKCPLFLTYGIHHLQYFSEDSITSFLKQHGFDVLVVRRSETSLAALSKKGSGMKAIIYNLSLRSMFIFARLLGKQNKLVLIAQKAAVA